MYMYMYGEKGILMIALWCSTFSSHGAKAQKPYYTCSYYFDYLHLKHLVEYISERVVPVSTQATSSFFLLVCRA